MFNIPFPAQPACCSGSEYLAYLSTVDKYIVAFENVAAKCGGDLGGRRGVHGGFSRRVCGGAAGRDVADSVTYSAGLRGWRPRGDWSEWRKDGSFPTFGAFGCDSEGGKGCSGGESTSVGGAGRVSRAAAGAGSEFGGDGNGSAPAELTSAGGLGGDSGGAGLSVDERKKSRKLKAARRRANKRKLQAKVEGDSCDSDDAPVWRRKSFDMESKRKNLTTSPARFIAGLVNEYNSAELATSVEAKWIAKNKLETAKVERELRLLEATDVEAEARKRNAQNKADYERHLVSIEKSHGRLLAADCVPAEDMSDEERSRIHTVGSSSISPSSSVSEAEVRAIQKKNLDLEKTVEELYKALAKFGVSRDNVDELKSEFTCDVNGNLTPESHKIAMKLSPQGYITDHLPYQKLEPDENGKYHIGVMLY